MGTMSSPNTDETDHLLRRAVAGDEASWRALLGRHEKRLRRLIALRMDHRVQGRIDAEDVVQEVHLAAWGHLGDYLREPKMPFFLWLRGIAGNKLKELHRHHLGVRMRDASREVSLYRGTLPEATSAALAA